MEKKPHPDDFGISLVQSNGAQRAMVAKMRSKLAGGSEFDQLMVQRHRVAVRKNAFGWASKLGIAAILILVNLGYLAYRHETGAQKKTAHRALTLPLPKLSMGVNDQALYWTYALYDYNRLTTQFGVPQNAVVEAGAAYARLLELLPKVDANTLFTIQGYLPPKMRTP